MYRYICAALLSVAIHFLIFAPLLEQPAMAIPLAQEAQSVSISFTKPAPKKVEKPVAPVAEAKEVVQPAPKKVETKPVIKTEKKRIVKQKTEPKKIKKEIPQPVKEVVKKKPEPKKQIEKVIKPPKEVVKAQPTPAPEPAAVIKDKTAITKQKTAQQSNELDSKPQLVQKSRFLSTPTPPKYPRMAKRRGIEGTVTYEVWLDEKGKQTKLLLKDSSGAKVLDVAALKAIKNWEFSPHIVNGKRIAHRIYIPISFQLD